MSDKRCGTSSTHGPHAWGDLNWCPGIPVLPAVDAPDATASEPLSEGLTEAEQSWGIPYSGRHIFMEQDVERIVAAREAAAATRARAEGAAAERERSARRLLARLRPPAQAERAAAIVRGDS